MKISKFIHSVLTKYRLVIGFSTIPLLSLLVPFLALPVIARISTTTEWVAIALGQSIGTLASIVLNYGWSMIGPSRVLGYSITQSEAVYLESSHSRLILSLVIIPISVFVTLLISPPESSFLAVMMMISVGITGFSPMWFWVGRSLPLSALVYETLPRAIVGILVLPVLIFYKNVYLYPVVLIVASLSGYIVHRIKVFPQLGLLPKDLASAIRILKRDFSAGGSLILAGGYTSLTVPIVVTFTSLANSSEFVTGFKIYGLSLQVILVANNVFQARLKIFDKSDKTTRSLRQFQGIYAIFGLLGFVLFASAGSLASEILFGQKYQVSSLVMAIFGLSFFAICMNSSFGRLFLIPLGLEKFVFRSTIFGAIIGIPIIVVGTVFWGVIGAAIAFAASEVFVYTLQVWFYFNWKKASRFQT